MKAIVYRTYGPPDVLQQVDLTKPVPADNEILIRVHAVEATKADCEMRRFKFAVKWFWLPMRLAIGLFRPRKGLLGGYFAGEIESVGSKVSRFAPGDQIFGCTGISFGAYAEYLCLPDNCTLALKPAEISYEAAAATPLGGLNALHFMTQANLQPGDKVLINGAGGSIGTFGVQIAKAMGAEVTAVDSSIKEKMLLAIGADRFVDYETQDIVRSGETFDVIFNMVAGSDYTAMIRALTPGGRYLMANPRLSDMLRTVLTSKTSRKQAIFRFAAEKEQELLTLKEMIEDGRIRPVIDRLYPYQEAAAAHRRVETEQRAGIVVISMV